MFTGFDVSVLSISESSFGKKRKAFSRKFAVLIIDGFVKSHLGIILPKILHKFKILLAFSGAIWYGLWNNIISVRLERSMIRN